MRQVMKFPYAGLWASKAQTKDKSSRNMEVSGQVRGEANKGDRKDRQELGDHSVTDARGAEIPKEMGLGVGAQQYQKQQNGPIRCRAKKSLKIFFKSLHMLLVGKNPD